MAVTLATLPGVDLTWACVLPFSPPPLQNEHDTHPWGEKARFGRTDPITPFNPLEGGWGAFELAARVGYASVDHSAIDNGFAVGSNGATDLTLGLNWYLNRLVLFRLNYNRVWFEDEITVGGNQLNGEDSILARFQLEF